MAKRFDLLARLEGMFVRADENGDYSGCVSLARVIRELQVADAAALAAKKATSVWPPMDEWTKSELAEFDQLYDAMEALDARVYERLGLTKPAPTR